MATVAVSLLMCTVKQCDDVTCIGDSGADDTTAAKSSTARRRPPVKLTRTKVVKYSREVHCKNSPYIHGYFVASFPYFHGTSSIYVCIRKSTTSLY